MRLRGGPSFPESSLTEGGIHVNNSFSIDCLVPTLGLFSDLRGSGRLDNNSIAKRHAKSN
jgi:hypothetical protein